MSTEDYERICSTIYEQIYEKLERKDDERLRFARRGTAKDVLKDHLLRRFLRSLVPPSISTEDGLGIREEVFTARIKDRKLYPFLAVLIFATCGIEAARTFVVKLVATPTWDDRARARSRLPANRETLVELFGSVVAADKFFTKQACFCTVVLRKGEEVHVSDPSTQRLPYLEEQPLNKGSFGKVSRVVVARGHFFDPDSARTGFAYNDRHLEMARKDYEINSEHFPRAGQEERAIMDKILGSSLQGRRCDNIVDNWGSVEIAPDTYSLFMPKATCDLRAYMMEHHKLRPATTEAKAEMIACAEGLAAGLNFLHTEMKTPDFEDMVCYHMDLKPDNVLVFHERGRQIWKLSDFGMARVKIRHRGQGGFERERDFNSWFKRRKQRVDPSLSATMNRRAEGTYLAPESVSVRPSMTTKSDVWALGCVLSVVFAYLEAGAAGVESYTVARLQHNKSDDYDRFFVRGKFAPSELHPEVKRWHDHLGRQASQRSIAEGRIVKDILGNLEKGPLEVDQDKRCDAKTVRRMLADTCKAYKSLADEHATGDAASDSSQLPTPTPRRFHHLLPGLQRINSKETVARALVDTWHLSSTEDFKGCEISPDGTLVAYWTDTKIALYTSQSLSSGNAFEATPASDYSLGESENSIWKSISLTEKHLIASTTGSTFNCYIFDLLDGPTEDAMLGDPEKVVITRLPEIQKLALSPNSRVLACVLRQEEDDRGPGSLFYADVADLIRLSKASGSAANREVSGNREPPGWKPPVRLDWPAPDVIYLSISNKRDIHLVIRPELTAKVLEHKIPVIHVSLEHSTIDTLNIESKGFDSSSAVGFFTTFTPLTISTSSGDRDSTSPASTAVLVTREKRLHVQAFAGEGPARGDTQREVQHYRVLKLLGCREPDRLLAVGTASANQKMMLLEIALPQPGDRGKGGIAARGIAQLPGLLYGNEFTARLAEVPQGGGGERFVLVAALVATNRRRAIYKVHLTGMESGL